MALALSGGPHNRPTQNTSHAYVNCGVEFMRLRIGERQRLVARYQDDYSPWREVLGAGGRPTIFQEIEEDHRCRLGRTLDELEWDARMEAKWKGRR